MPPSRRRCLFAAVGSLPLTAGCLQSGPPTAGTATDAGTETETATDAGTEPSVTVTRSRNSDWAPTSWERTLLVDAAEGRVTERLVCDGATETDSASLPDSELEPFRALAGNDAVGSLASTYECTEGCPTDIPSTTVTITTPSRDRTVTVEPGADTPALLDRVMAALETASERVSTGGCGSGQSMTDAG